MSKSSAVRSMAVVSQETQMRNWLLGRLGILASLLVKVATMTRVWISRSDQRRALCDLDDHLLRDIGVSRQEALREIAKWFWQR